MSYRKVLEMTKDIGVSAPFPMFVKPRYDNSVVTVEYPWKNVQLSKKERRGKTEQEIAAIREAKWRASHITISDDQELGKETENV